MSEAVQLSVIIPALNEERNLPSLIQEVQQLPGMTLEVIVVDDGSRDATAQVAEAAGARVRRLPHNRGKGAALKAGFELAKGAYIVQIDADQQFPTTEIPRLVQPLVDGADVVFGSRFVRGSVIEPGSMALENRIAHPVICFAGWLACGLRVHDVMAGFKSFRRECARALDLETPHFGYEAEVLVKSGIRGYRLAEVPITFYRRRHGASNVKKFQDGCKVLWTIARIAWKEQRSRRLQPARLDTQMATSNRS